jgi:peptide subunit release factor 1 (eRF1)
VVLLVGTAEMVAHFERELPERVRTRVLARLPRPRGWQGNDGVRNDGIIAGAGKIVHDHEVKLEERAVDSVVGQALRGGLGVLGPRDVIDALNQGRVHKLVIEADFDRNGWQCDNCNALGENTEALEACPYCGAHVHGVHVLGEAMIARALREDAEVEVVAHTNKLHSYRGVGAFLRQTAPTGLRGASQPWPTAPGASRP